MEETKTQDGLIGFFDILGYQSFLENNDPESAAAEVLTVINNIGSITSTGLMSSIKAGDPEKKDTIKGSVDRIQWLVFSDTILMAMSWDEPNKIDFCVFVLAAVKLCRHMFDFGLPLRGAIKNGRYLVSKSCFAGRVIVDAYNVETSLNLAGCAINEDLLETMKEKVNPEWIERPVVRYMTPLTNGQPKKMSLLNYLVDDHVTPKPNAFDIPQLVLNSFWAHGKDITPSAETKAKNTESFLRFLLHRFPDQFADKPG
jgi:hypothetical protein